MNAMNPQHENAQTVTSMTMIQALRSAMDIMLERDCGEVTVLTHAKRG
ncbi:hypothetical protein ACSER3_28120, partial [Pseudomonas aeruginosa]